MPTLSPKTTPYYGGGQAVDPANVKKTKLSSPGTTLTDDRLGTIQVNNATASAWMLVSKSGGVDTWLPLGTGMAGDIQTLTGGSGGALTPTAGNINLLGTANQITSTGSGSTITFSLPAAITAPGSIAATTSLTATLGNITATNGNIVLGTAGNKIIVATGSNASAGVSGAMSGSPGAVTVATTACSTTAQVMYCRKTTGGTPGQVSITAQDGTGFTLTSTGNETSTFNWWIINA